MINAQSQLHSPLTLGEEETSECMDTPSRPYPQLRNVHSVIRYHWGGWWARLVIGSQGSWS